MEDSQNHPIPQDVTGFQFKIIGDMTVKQFAYLAGSAVLAWIFYQLPIISFIRVPLAICIGGIGPALAFLPIEGRPMDMMIYQFIRALFKPTRFVYQKNGGNTWLSTVTKSIPNNDSLHGQKPNEQSREYVHSPIAPLPNYLDPAGNLPKSQTQTPILQNQITAARIMSMYASATPSQNIPSKPAPQPLQEINDDKEEALKKRVLDLEKDLEKTKKEKTKIEQIHPNPSPVQPQESSGLEAQLQGMLAQKEELTKQLITLQQKLDFQKKNIYTPTMATSPQNDSRTKIQTQNVRQIPKGMEKNIGLPIAPEAPNVIAGIIKDPRGNPLGNILVEIKDKEGNPVRAFKTNGLGQFVSATPLVNGNYTILFEDPKGENKFDAIEFNATGDVILPIEAKSIDTREELRKSLFGES